MPCKRTQRETVGDPMSSFADVLASMGETGELGENPRLSLDVDEAKERRIRPGTGDAGEQFAHIRPAFAQPNPLPIKEIRPIRPIRPDQTEIQDVALWAWLVVFQGYALEVYCHPIATHEEIKRKYPAAILIEPLPECMHARDPNRQEADA